jgi:5-methylcytosine-specific restriction endonuclease McrA
MPYKSKEERREYKKIWIAKRRADFFKDKCCVKCGYRKKLELDHINRENKISHNIWSWTKSKREKELEKCQVLCYTCHKEKTKLESIALRQHGRTWYGYGCRCEICYKAQQQHNAQRSKVVC